jgi:hypothetical protein
MTRNGDHCATNSTSVNRLNRDCTVIYLVNLPICQFASLSSFSKPPSGEATSSGLSQVS